MTELSMFLFLAVTTVYGWLMFRQGQRSGITSLVGLMTDAGVVRSAQSLGELLDAHAEKNNANL